ncbi:MAG: hypothetical protein RI975_635, partial [Pseudomonadota bacterium]
CHAHQITQADQSPPYSEYTQPCVKSKLSYVKKGYTLVYYMGRKDAAKIALQLISQSNLPPQTPVHTLR